MVAGELPQPLPSYWRGIGKIFRFFLALLEPPGSACAHSGRFLKVECVSVLSPVSCARLASMCLCLYTGQYYTRLELQWHPWTCRGFRPAGSEKDFDHLDPEGCHRRPPASKTVSFALGLSAKKPLINSSRLSLEIFPTSIFCVHITFAIRLKIFLTHLIVHYFTFTAAFIFTRLMNSW